MCYECNYIQTLSLPLRQVSQFLSFERHAYNYLVPTPFNYGCYVQFNHQAWSFKQHQKCSHGIWWGWDRMGIVGMSDRENLNELFPSIACPDFRIPWRSHPSLTKPWAPQLLLPTMTCAAIWGRRWYQRIALRRETVKKSIREIYGKPLLDFPGGSCRFSLVCTQIHLLYSIAQNYSVCCLYSLYMPGGRWVSSIMDRG